MNDNYIVAVYVIVDDLLRAMHYKDDVRSTISAAEIITVAIVAAKHFQNHHEQTVPLMVRLGYIRSISLSRFNRRLHALADWLLTVSQAISELFATGNLFIVDAMPVPVCKRVRAQRCKKVQGQAYHGYCAAKKEHFFGWQLHLICDACGIPVAYDLLPARWDELVPIQSLLAVLPKGSRVVADKGYLSYKDQVLAWTYGDVDFIAKYRKNMRGNSPEDARLIALHRSRIETVNSQLEKMGVQHLHARTNTGFSVKVLASLIALAFTNFLF